MPNRYYITFGQRSPFRDGYVLIEAYEYSQARRAAIETLGQKWAFIYLEKDFDHQFYPAGQLGRTINA